MPRSKTSKVLALAASAFAIGSFAEAHTAFLMAGRVAQEEGIDVWEVCDEMNLNGAWTVPWTVERAPTHERMRGVDPIDMPDGSTYLIFEGPSGVMIERWVPHPGDDYRMVARGFWRDCEIQEAVYFAREIWG